MTTTAILCSGQGAQAAGMFELLADAPPAARVFAAAEAALGGRDPRDLVRRASTDELHANEIGQVLCCTQAMAAWAVLDDVVRYPLVVAGYSVGELAAWGVAGVLDAHSVLELAVRRASAMDRAADRPSGLLAVRGLSRRRLEPLCRAHDCHVAIVNGPDQMLVGGARAALRDLAGDAEAHGAQHVTPLPVAVASHTPLMNAASERFRHALARANLAAVRSGVRLLSGVDGAPVFDVAAGLDKLALQIRQTVDWAACMDGCRSAGVSRILELGPGTGLVRLAREAMPQVEAHAVCEFRSIEGLRRWIAAAAT